MARRRSPSTEAGQASVDLIGAIPALLVAVLIAAQLIAAGHALWSAGLAARAGARAAVVGRDATPAARRALPGILRRGSLVVGGLRRGSLVGEGLRRGSLGGEGGGVAVSVGVPRLVPGLPELRVSARTSLEADGG